MKWNEPVPNRLRIAALMVLVASALVLCTGQGWAFEAVGLIVIGWAQFLYRVLPGMRFSATAVASGVICFIAVIVLGHLIARWLWRETPDSPDVSARHWRPRWTLVGVCVIVLMFVCGIAATGVAHQSGWLLSSDRPLLEDRSGGSERARRVQCQSNLRQIGQSLFLYAKEHGGRMPNSFDELFDDEVVTARVFNCPAALYSTGLDHDEGLMSFVYHGRGLTIDLLAPSRALVCEPLANHDAAGMNVLFGDGSVQFLKPSDAQRLSDNGMTLPRTTK